MCVLNRKCLSWWLCTVSNCWHSSHWSCCSVCLPRKYYDTQHTCMQIPFLGRHWWCICESTTAEQTSLCWEARLLHSWRYVFHLQPYYPSSFAKCSIMDFWLVQANRECCSTPGINSQGISYILFSLALTQARKQIVCRSIKSTALPTSLKSALRAGQFTWFHSFCSPMTQVAIGLRYGINLTYGHLGWVVYLMRRTANFKIFITFVHPTKFQLLKWLHQWLKSFFIFKMKRW